MILLMPKMKSYDRKQSRDFGSPHLTAEQFFYCHNISKLCPGRWGKRILQVPLTVWILGLICLLWWWITFPVACIIRFEEYCRIKCLQLYFSFCCLCVYKFLLSPDKHLKKKINIQLSNRWQEQRIGDTGSCNQPHVLSSDLIRVLERVVMGWKGNLEKEISQGVTQTILAIHSSSLAMTPILQMDHVFVSHTDTFSVEELTPYLLHSFAPKWSPADKRTNYHTVPLFLTFLLPVYLLNSKPANNAFCISSCFYNLHQPVSHFCTTSMWPSEESLR